MHESDFYAHNVKYLPTKDNYDLNSSEFLRRKVNHLTVQCFCVLFAMATHPWSPLFGFRIKVAIRGIKFQSLSPSIGRLPPW